MSVSKYERMMFLALELARKAASAGEIPVGALIARDGEVLGRGFNQREALHDPTAHAEILALRDAARRLGDWRLSGCTLYTTLEPCPLCAGGAAMARVSLIVYGARDPAMGCCGSIYDIPGDDRFGASVPFVGGVLGVACSELLSNHLRERRARIKA